MQNTLSYTITMATICVIKPSCPLVYSILDCAVTNKINTYEIVLERASIHEFTVFWSE